MLDVKWYTSTQSPWWRRLGVMAWVIAAGVCAGPAVTVVLSVALGVTGTTLRQTVLAGALGGASVACCLGAMWMWRDGEKSKT